jgi:hypothetical protein
VRHRLYLPLVRLAAPALVIPENVEVLEESHERAGLNAEVNPINGDFLIYLVRHSSS